MTALRSSAQAFPMRWPPSPTWAASRRACRGEIDRMPAASETPIRSAPSWPLQHDSAGISPANSCPVADVTARYSSARSWCSSGGGVTPSRCSRRIRASVARYSSAAASPETMTAPSRWVHVPASLCLSLLVRGTGKTPPVLRLD